MTAGLFARKHALWLRTLFTSFMVDDAAFKAELYDFSQIAFRHMRWIARELHAHGTEYTYDRELLLGTPETVADALKVLVSEIEALAAVYPKTVLASRIGNDEAYMCSRLHTLLASPEAGAPLSAFNRRRILPGKTLDKRQTDALTLFLFEESYKEYELILVYAYMLNRSSSVIEHDVYQDLIDESHYHLKSFGNLMAQMGILALPRPLHEQSYRIEDVKGFIRNGIEEEENAKAQCRELSDAIGEETLSAFFDFINYQESYHIELMRTLL